MRGFAERLARTTADAARADVGHWRPEVDYDAEIERLLAVIDDRWATMSEVVDADDDVR